MGGYGGEAWPRPPRKALRHLHTRDTRDTRDTRETRPKSQSLRRPHAQVRCSTSSARSSVSTLPSAPTLLASALPSRSTRRRRLAQGVLPHPRAYP